MIPASKLGSSVAESDGVPRIEKSIPQKRRIDNISDKNQRRNKFMKKMVALAFGDYDAGELGKRSECGAIWHSGLVQ